MAQQTNGVSKLMLFFVSFQMQHEPISFQTMEDVLESWKRPGTSDGRGGVERLLSEVEDRTSTLCLITQISEAVLARESSDFWKNGWVYCKPVLEEIITSSYQMSLPGETLESLKTFTHGCVWPKTIP